MKQVRTACRMARRDRGDLQPCPIVRQTMLGISLTLTSRTRVELADRSYRGYALRAPSESTLSLRSAPSSLSRSLSRNSGSVVNVNVVSPRPTVLPLASVVEPVPEHAESLISQVVSPRLPASVRASRSVSSISERLSRAITPSLRPSLSRQPTPRIPSPMLSPTRSMSHGPASTVPALNGIMRQSSSLASSVATDNKDDSRTDSDSEGTVPPQNLTPKPKLARLVPPAKPSASISWHCRVCLKDDCVAPMATMCGHVFCTGYAFAFGSADGARDDSTDTVVL